MEKNKRLNPRNIFEKPIYHAIFYILESCKNNKIKFCHLKYVLVDRDYKKIKVRMENFFSGITNEEVINQLSEGIKKGKGKNIEILKLFLKEINQNNLDLLIKNQYIKPEDKLGSESSLRDKIYELIELGLIKKIPENKGYPYYEITEKGMIHYKRWNIHNTIDIFIKDDYKALNDFSNMVTEYFFKKSGILIR